MSKTNYNSIINFINSLKITNTTWALDLLENIDTDNNDILSEKDHNKTCSNGFFDRLIQTFKCNL